MASITIEKLATGMILKGDVRDPLGRLLIGGGTVVSDRHARILKKWGIRLVDIEAEDGEEDPTITPEILREAERIVEGRFRHVDLNHPFVAELHQQVVDRVARSLAAEEPRGS